MKTLILTISLFMIIIISLCVNLCKVTDTNSNRLEILVLDSLRSHTVINRQNEIIIHFKKYGNLYVKEEDNCFTNGKNNRK